MATINQDPNQPTLDAIDQMFNGLRLVSPFNDLGSIMGDEVPQEMTPQNGQIQPVGFIEPNAIDTSDLFADDIMPPAVVAALPTLPDASYPNGRLVFLTSDGKLYRNYNDSWTVAVDGADITANSITAGSIAAGAIGADQLAAQIVLASQILTAVSGSRVELDNQGIRVYSSSDALLFNAPTDGSDLYVNAEVEALGLTVTGDAVFQGSGNQLALGSILTAQVDIQKPTAAPTLTQGWDTVSRAAPIYRWYNLDYDSAGGAGGATKVFWTFEQDQFGGYTVTELKASDGTVNRQMGSDLETELATHGVDTTGLNAYGICRHSSYVYVLVSTNPAPTFATSWGVARYLASDLSFNTFYSGISMPLSASASQHPRIASDGTNPYIVDKGTGTASVKWNKYNDTMVKQGSTQDTGHSPASGAMIRDCAVGNFDFGAWRMVITTDSDSAFTYDNTPANQPNETFPIQPDTGFGGGITYGDALGDGARFWSAMGSSSNQTVITKHTTWTWTSASSIYWVAYSWYDDVGTAHETEVGPRASITMGRRKKLTITAAALPGTGGADEPNKHRAYMVPKATAPATTELKLQNAFADTVTVERTYDSGGAAPQTSNGFAGLGSAAEIKSATTGWSLKGDGTASFGDLSASGTVTTSKIRITSTTDAALASTDHGLQVGSTASTNVIIDNNEIMARNNGATSDLFLQNDGGDVHIDASGSRTYMSGASISGAGVASRSALSMGANGIDFADFGGTPGAPSASHGVLYCDTSGGLTRIRWRTSTGTVTIASV